ncbi:hypothetical protein M758_6G144500 [Ceratodon purpureus]|nr:hypothetical protein M758_6G144500 [Ceratodon purpureus]
MPRLFVVFWLLGLGITKLSTLQMEYYGKLCLLYCFQDFNSSVSHYILQVLFDFSFIFE